MQIMKNWKTTLAGMGTAVLMVIVQMIIAKGVFNPVIDIAAIGIGILGYLAGDKNVEQTIKESPTLTAILGSLDKLSAAVADAQPSNLYVKEIHGFLSALDQNIQGLNRYDVGNTGGQYSHWVQFSNVSGGGNQINYNRFEDVTGQALHPHDHISIYYSNGKIGDSIQVIGNMLRGGQQFAWPCSGCQGVGITIADVQGTYQVVRGNILVNTGYEGILFYSSGKGVKIDHNKVFGSPVGISLTGIAVSGSNQIEVSYNQVKWYKAAGSLFSSWYNAPSTPQPAGWGTNNFNASIDASILPAKLITWQ